MDTTHTPEQIAEADSRWSGCLDGSQYSDIESALADLHGVDPSDLLGSDLLTRLYRSAKACHELRARELAQMDEAAAEKAERESEDGRAWQHVDAALWA
jgi:hypothetical protein